MVERIMDNAPPLDATERDTLLRAYAAGDITWHELQQRGFDNYLVVLAGLGELQLRPPVATMAGPNLLARQRGRAFLRRAFGTAP